MKLIITRHGLTEGNAKRILADIDDELNSEGVEQVRKLSKRLEKERIAAIYCSPLIRAKKTAEIIAKNHPNAKVIFSDDLREMDLGSYLNKGFDDVDWENMPDDVESRTSMYKRAKIVLEKVIKEYPDGTVLFVSHNALNKALIRFLRGWNPEDKQPIHQDNAAVTIFEIKCNEVKEILFNDTKHLE